MRITQIHHMKMLENSLFGWVQESLLQALHVIGKINPAAETLADPYKGEPLYLEFPITKSHLLPIMSSSKRAHIPGVAKPNQYLEHSPETHRIHLFPPIATE
jgi:hypothetical protein